MQASLGCCIAWETLRCKCHPQSLQTKLRSTKNEPMTRAPSAWPKDVQAPADESPLSFPGDPNTYLDPWVFQVTTRTDQALGFRFWEFDPRRFHPNLMKCSLYGTPITFMADHIPDPCRFGPQPNTGVYDHVAPTQDVVEPLFPDSKPSHSQTRKRLRKPAGLCRRLYGLDSKRASLFKLVSPEPCVQSPQPQKHSPEASLDLQSA